MEYIKGVNDNSRERTDHLPGLTASYKKDLENQRELIQNDLQCVLDGLDEQIVDNACHVIVDRFKILIDSL